MKKKVNPMTCGRFIRVAGLHCTSRYIYFLFHGEVILIQNLVVTLSFKPGGDYQPPSVSSLTHKGVNKLSSPPNTIALL